MVGTIQFGELIQFIQNFADLVRPLVPGDRDGQDNLKLDVQELS